MFVAEGYGCYRYKIACDGIGFYGSAKHSDSLCEVKDAERYCIGPVALFGKG